MTDRKLNRDWWQVEIVICAAMAWAKDDAKSPTPFDVDLFRAVATCLWSGESDPGVKNAVEMGFAQVVKGNSTLMAQVIQRHRRGTDVLRKLEAEKDRNEWMRIAESAVEERRQELSAIEKGDASS